MAGASVGILQRNIKRFVFHVRAFSTGNGVSASGMVKLIAKTP